MKKYVGSFLKWCGIGLLVGVIVGAVGIAFHFAMELCAAARGAHLWLIWLLPLGGLLIPLMYMLCRVEKDRGTNLVIAAIRTEAGVPLRIAPLIFVSTALTHLLGGSSGREGAALQIGGSVAGGIGRLLRLDEKDMHIMTMCGMSAAFSAVFGTPITAVIFSMEVVSIGVMYYSAIVPCTVSALTAMMLAKSFGISAMSLGFGSVPDMTPLAAAQVGLLAILCALVSILFCYAMKAAHRLYSRFLPDRFLRIAAGGAIVALLTFALGTQDYNGAGTELIKRAFSADVAPWAFLVKIALTALTLGAGYKGGEIVPCFCTGATFGSIAGGLLGLSPAFSSGIGLAALFCGVTNCPLTAVILSVELFGGQGLGFFALACAISYLLSGYSGLYSAQKVVYSKTRAEYVNKDVE